MSLVLICSILTIFVVRAAEGVHCPYYCNCFVADKLRQVHCVGKGLISLELDVPRTVQSLKLSNNSIYEVKDNIFSELGLGYIVKLELDNNAIQSVGLHSFLGLQHLRYLDLSGNHLYYLPIGIFEKNPVLAYLNLQGNPLRYIRSTFLISKAITTLDISNCRLNRLPHAAFGGMPSLSRINISKNHLEVIGKNTFENLTKLKEVDISGNKMICDKEMKSLQSWLESNKVLTTGIPCLHHLKTNEVPNEMFERMMVAPAFNKDTETEFNDNSLGLPAECSCNNTDTSPNVYKQVDSTEEISEEHEGSTARQNRVVKVTYNPLFLILAFVNGLIVGVAFSLSFWVCVRWQRARRINTRARAAYNPMPYEGPPPAYSELF